MDVPGWISGAVTRAYKSVIIIIIIFVIKTKYLITALVFTIKDYWRDNIYFFKIIHYQMPKLTTAKHIYTCVNLQKWNQSTALHTTEAFTCSSHFGVYLEHSHDNTSHKR